MFKLPFKACSYFCLWTSKYGKSVGSSDSAFQKSVSILCLKLTDNLMNFVELGCDMPAFGQSRGKEECQNKKKKEAKSQDRTGIYYIVEFEWVFKPRHDEQKPSHLLLKKHRRSVCLPFYFLLGHIKFIWCNWKWLFLNSHLWSECTSTTIILGFILSRP